MVLGSFTYGFATLVMLWLLYRLLEGSWNPWKVVEGADGRPSTSKLQWFLWTAVVVFSYATVYAARAAMCHFEVIANIPQHLLIAMGFSLTTMAAAKGITVSYVASGQATKKKADKKPDQQAGQPASGSTGTEQGTNTDQPASGLSSIIKDDTGFPDLSKIQMMAWTLIATLVYLIRVGHEISLATYSGAVPELPDIDPALMVLMGLGQGAYLGKKLVTTATPRLTGLSPGSAEAKPDTTVTISGLSFGKAQGGSLITIGGNPIPPDAEVVRWEDTQITFKFPAKQANREEWSYGQPIAIGVIVNGRESANTLPFTVVKSVGG